MRGLRLSGWIALAAGLLWAGQASALTDEEIFRDFRFDFMKPGARSVGMAGAFVAVAEDTTATESNPAALHYVTRPEVLVEFRGTQAETSTVSSNFGSLDVDPLTSARDLPFLQLTSVSEPESVGTLGYLGFAWSSRPGSRRLTLAASRQIVLAQERTLDSPEQTTEARFAFESFPNTVNGSVVEAYSVATPVTGRIESEIVYWNLGASFEVHTDFSIGATLSAAELDLKADTLTEVVDPQELFLDPTHPRLPALPTIDLYRTTIDDNDTDLAFSLGVHWHPDSAFTSGSSPWRFGAVFRKGASFTVRETASLNETPDQAFETSVVVPDRYSVGAMYRPAARWTLALEAERIEYSDMLDGFRGGVNYLTSGRVAGDAFGVDPAAEVRYDVDDGTIPRIGVEYARTVGADRLLSFQLGYYRSADNRIRMTSFNSDDPAVNQVYLDAFRGADEENHYTFGLGIELGRSVLRAAADLSDEGDQVVANYVFRFGAR